jgi:hypothetical protein
MKNDLFKKMGLAVLMLLFLAISGFSQKEPDFKDEMIKSGERYEIPEEFKTSAGDYDSFLKSKLLNSPASDNTIFFEPRELGISSIGGRVRAALVDKTNQINLVAPSGGGLWKFNSKTNDEFTPINDFGSFMAITDIAQNPSNSNHILIGTGDGLHGIPGNGLFESKDGGKTFSKMISVDSKSNSDFNYIRFVKFSPYDNKTIYFTTNYKLYKSTNSGLNWFEVFNSGYSNIHSLDFLDGESIIVGVDNKGIFISTNGNQGSFVLMSKDLPNDAAASSNGPIDGVVAATHATNRKIAYAFITGSSNDIYKTTDNGVTWTLLPKPDFYIAQTWFCLTIGVHPVNPDIVILGSVAWAYSTDGGSSWKEGAGLEVDFHSAHFHGSDPNVAYLGYDQGLGRVDFNKFVDAWIWDGSKYMIEKQPEQIEIGKNEGFNTSQIYYGDYFPKEYGDSYLQGQQDGGCFGRVDNNAKRIVVGDGGSVFVNKQNPLKAYSSTQMGNLYFTSSAIPAAYNYSKIGNFYNNHPNWITQFDGNNANGNQIYISNKTSIQRTLDGGVSFDSIVAHSLNSVKIAVQDSVNPWVYAVGYNQANGKLDLITIKQAATNPITTTINDILSVNYVGVPDHIEIDPNDENSVFITSSAGNAFKISNINTGTLSRKSLKGDIENVVFNTVIGVKNKSEILIAGTNIGLFYSTNSGANWILSNKLPYTQITDLKLRESDNRLFVFTHGRGTWAVTLLKSLNKAPFANAGTDQSINEGVTFTLDGSSSSDPDGNTITYKWTSPAGITLSSSTDAKPTFTAPEVKKDSILIFYLTVNDGFENSVAATVKITVLNVIKVGNSETSTPAFKVYPNPTTGMFTLKFNQSTGKKTEISVSNLIGAEVFRKELDNATNYQIDLSNQVSGIYLLKVIVDNRQYISKIVIRKE